MENILLPLYKLLCITIFLLVPLLPAWGLYKIAPKERILAKGNFQGFKINATGAIAIFIVLFAAIYTNISDINKTIDTIAKDNDRIEALTTQVETLQKQIPWKIQCKIKLADDEETATSYKAYENCLRPDYIQAFPMPLTINSNTKVVSFYVDDDVLKNYDNTYTIILPGGYGSRKVLITDSLKDKNNKSIFLNATFTRNSTADSLSGNNGAALTRLDKTDGSLTPPKILIQKS